MIANRVRAGAPQTGDPAAARDCPGEPPCSEGAIRMDLGAGLRAIFALAFTLALLGGLAWLAMRFDFASLFNKDPEQPESGANPKTLSDRVSRLLKPKPAAQRRLHIVEQRPIDARSRLMIVRWDDVEHLILVGGGGGDGIIASKAAAQKAPGDSV